MGARNKSGAANEPPGTYLLNLLMRTMLLHVLEQKPTPNPHAIQLVLDARIASRPRSITSRLDASADTLAEELMAISGVSSVFYFENVITITKNSYENWPVILAAARRVIESAEVENLTARALQEKSAPPVPVAADGTDLRARYPEILDVIEREIRPGLTLDGGGIEVVGLTGPTLTIRYQGACGSCTSATTGTLMFIRQTLQNRIDPRLEVQIV